MTAFNSPAEQPVLSIRDLKKRFGAKVVLDGVNLDVFARDSLVIIGGSGTGKSVLLKCIMGLMEPDAGQILIHGQDMTTLRESEREKIRRDFGMLFQYAALFDSLPVWENVAFGLTEVQKMPRQDAYRIAVDKLRAVGIGEEFTHRVPADLSAGMRKRIGLARAIATTPQFLFFDEPTTGLDPIMGNRIDRLIVESLHSLNACAMTITHDMDSARRIASRIAMLYQGKFVFDGACASLDTTENPYIRQFINAQLDGPIQTP